MVGSGVALCFAAGGFAAGERAVVGDGSILGAHEHGEVLQRGRGTIGGLPGHAVARGGHSRLFLSLGVVAGLIGVARSVVEV